MQLTESMKGYGYSFRASGKSNATRDLYLHTINMLAEYFNDPDVKHITIEHLVEFMAYLADEYVPVRFDSSTHPLSQSSLQNHFKALRSYFAWAENMEYKRGNPALKLEFPEGNPELVNPLREDEIRAILSSAEATYCAPKNRKPFVMARRTAIRDIALLLLMLETGIRVGELCRLNIEDVNWDREEIHVAPFNAARKTKPRFITLTDGTLDALWKYVAKERKNALSIEPLFLTERGERMTTNAVRLLFADLGKKAGVDNFHPHRLRHTFAIEFLRQRPDIYTLQAILGHSTLEMVQTYLKIAQTDIAAAQKACSPVATWKLKAPVGKENQLRRDCPRKAVSQERNSKAPQTTRNEKSVAPSTKPTRKVTPNSFQECQPVNQITQVRPRKTEQQNQPDRVSTQSTSQSCQSQRQSIVSTQTMKGKRRFNPFSPQGRAG